MRKYILICSLLFSVMMTAQEIQLSWKKDINIATEISKSESKPILVYFTKTNCDECQHFYSNFFKSDIFKDLSDNFVLLMLDGSNDDSNTTDISIIKQRRLVIHYNKTLKFPAVVVLGSDKQALGEILTSTDLAAISDYYTFLKTIK
ncbi:MAG: thioredoxin family protein [Aquaticitalea sp.]